MNGERIKEMLRERNMSQTELARRAGISKVNVNHIVNGERKGSVETLKKICAALGCDPKDVW